MVKELRIKVKLLNNVHQLKYLPTFENKVNKPAAWEGSMFLGKFYNHSRYWLKCVKIQVAKPNLQISRHFSQYPLDYSFF